MRKFNVWICLIPLVLTGSKAFAGKETGGGDSCENRIQSIRDDISLWIQGGGASELKLPEEVSFSTYNQSMGLAIQKVTARCVGAQDEGFPVTVMGTPKICRFDKMSGKFLVTCDYSKFGSTTEADQYVLIHHELAGLAGIENPDGADSHYEVSNQISEYLVDTVVQKLALKVPAPSIEKGSAYPSCLPRYEEQIARDKCIMTGSCGGLPRDVFGAYDDFQKMVYISNMIKSAYKTDGTELAEFTTDKTANAGLARLLRSENETGRFCRTKLFSLQEIINDLKGAESMTLGTASFLNP